ncbi:MAG: hypothetical protein AAFY76_26910 [Cyanobacteria bacterium J06649_11]
MEAIRCIHHQAGSCVDQKRASPREYRQQEIEYLKLRSRKVEDAFAD